MVCYFKNFIQLNLFYLNYNVNQNILSSVQLLLELIQAPDLYYYSSINQEFEIIPNFYGLFIYQLLLRRIVIVFESAAMQILC